MKKPAALLALLEELKAENALSRVKAVNGSKAYIYLDEHALATEDSIILNRAECGLLFDSKENVELLIEALGRPKHATIELHEIEPSLEVIEMLEREFAALVEV